MASSQSEEDLWLFGYGSLVWKGPPKYDKRVPGYIEGYVRRFWQASEDHRGTPEAPGRVVTLIPREHWETLVDAHTSAPPKVWGAAYRIPAVHVPEVKRLMDIREINGYSIDFAAFHDIPVYTSDAAKPSEPIKCLVYIGLPSNPQFLGPQDPDELAAHIVRSRGPSGENTEYVYNLAEALEVMSKDAGMANGDAGADILDEHVADIAKRVRAAESRIRAKDQG